MLSLPAFSQLDPHDPWPVVARRARRVRLIVVGAGGTGSWLVQQLARLVWVWNRAEAHAVEPRQASLLVVDPDMIEEKNVLARQNFCTPEIGFAKAQALVQRYALAFTLGKDEIAARVRPFSPSMVQHSRSDLVLLLGCVDNAQARAQMAACLEENDGPAPHLWYIDAGNGLHWGQVLVGTTPTLAALQGCLCEQLCGRLPSPALLAPSLFLSSSEQAPGPADVMRLSCGDLVLSEQEGNRQSRSINLHMAALVSAYVERLLYGSLTTFATYTDLASFATHSLTVTPQVLSRALNQPPAFASFLTTPAAHTEGDEDA